MGKQVVVQSDFSGGEISPTLHGRIDAQQYAKSLQTATNCIIKPQGPLQRRNGSTYISTTKYGNVQPSRLIPYQLDSVTGYIIELGDGYMRFYHNGLPIYSSGTTPYEITHPIPDIRLVQYVQQGSTMYIVHPSFTPYTLTRVTDTNWIMTPLVMRSPPTKEIGLPSTVSLAWGATTGTAVTFTAASSSFLNGDIGRQIINTSGVGYGSITAITDNTHVTVNISETFATSPTTSWKLAGSPVAFISMTSGTGALGTYATITAYTNSGKGTPQTTFRSTDLGKYLRFNSGFMKITLVTSSSVVSGVMMAATVDASDQSVWELETEIWNSTNGYPAAVGMFQQRLWFGNTTAYPQDLWGSASGNFNVFCGGADDADSINVTLVSNENNPIQWILGSKDLLVGTAGAEFAIHSAEGSGLPVTPSSITSLPGTAFGSAPGQSAIKLNNQTLFIQKGSTRILGYQYQYFVDNYKAPEVTFWAQHMSDEGLVRLAKASIPNSLLLGVLSSGDMMVGTYMPDQESPILGWSRWTTEGSYLDAAVISTGSNDEIWTIVSRTVANATVVYIERTLTTNVTNPSLTDTFSDCSQSYAAGPYPATDNYTVSSMTFANPAVLTTSATHDYTTSTILTNVSTNITHGISTFATSTDNAPISAVSTNTITLSGLSSVFSIISSHSRVGDPTAQVHVNFNAYTTHIDLSVTFTTTSSHGYSTGDTVYIVCSAAGDDGSTLYTITVNSSTTFTRTSNGINAGSGSLTATTINNYSFRVIPYSTPISISSANPAVITTSTPHKLTNGQSTVISIQNSMLGTLYYFLNGSYIVTVLSSTTFSVAYNGTPVFNSGNTQYTYTHVATPVTMLTGISFLEGDTVEVKMDGAQHPDVTVAGGIAQFEYGGSIIVLGLPYTTEIDTLPRNVQGPEGLLFLEDIRSLNTSLNVYSSVIPIVDGNVRPARRADVDDLDSPVPLFTGKLVYGPSPNGVDGKANCNIVASGPFPFILRNVITSTDGGVVN